MATIAYSKVSTTGTATLDATPATLDSTYGLIAGVKRYAGDSQDVTPTTPAGWTYIGGGFSGGTFRTGMYLYARRGDGTVNSITVDGPATSDETTITLLAAPNVKEDVFWHGLDEGGTTSTPSIALASPDTVTEAGSTAVAFGATGGTAGGSGFTVDDGFTQRGGGSTYSSVVWAEKDLPTAGAAVAPTIGWTTSGVGHGAVLILKTGTVTAPATVASVEQEARRLVDLSGSQGQNLSLTVEQISGPVVTPVVEGLVAYFVDDLTRTQAVTLRYTLSGDNGTVVDDVVVHPAGGGTVRVGPLAMIQGVLR